jgi:hypothetical protein
MGCDQSDLFHGCTANTDWYPHAYIHVHIHVHAHVHVHVHIDVPGLKMSYMEDQRSQGVPTLQQQAPMGHVQSDMDHQLRSQVPRMFVILT